MQITINSSTKKYNVNFYSNIKNLIDSFQNESLLFLIDKTVYNLYKNYFLNTNYYLIPASEHSKTLEYSSNVFNYLIDNDYKSDTHLVVIGGGILQDLGGFIASTFCRGINYTLVPTTLLAQCDSCIGGKTSINHNNRKNILGTFYPPNEIKICTQFLSTLSEFDLKSGYGELIKFYLLNNNLDNLNLNNLEEAILYGLKYKGKIIEIDEFDKSERKLLNFGHSFGHSLESTSDYKIPHGSAIIIGILIANEVSYNLGYVNREYCDKIKIQLLPHIKHLKLNKNWFDFSLLLSYLKSDKKNIGGNINMVLFNGENYYITPIKDLKILEKSLNNINEII
jgi:3-dehydroquinate synthase